MSDQYDVVVIGAGPGGYVAAIRAAQLGLKTAIIEKEYMGGVCLNVGCIPSKALLHNASVVHTLKHRGREFGFSVENLTVDYGVAFKRSRQIADRLVKGVGFLMKKNGIDVYDGTASIATPTTINVALTAGDTATLSTKNIIVATGATPHRIPGIEVDGKQIVTYKEAIVSETLPESIVIIGGGAIGVEFAYIMSNYGVDVTIVEMLPHLLPNEEPETSKVLEKAYKKLGVKVHTNTAVQSVAKQEGRLAVTLNDGTVLGTEQVMVAVGFKPNSGGLGLENAGVAVSDRGAIEIDEAMRTNVPGIYAIGDVTGKLMLAHVASAMGLIAAETIADHPTIELDYVMMPRATYAEPQVASFGYTEAQAIEQGYEVNVGQFPFQPNGKALGLGEREGFIKIIADKRYGEILGAHMVGPNVTELLPELTLAQMNELTAEEIARNVHAHPTLSEVLMEAAHGVEGQPIHM
jgi:dihydrolipoamide dehydrogenase